MCRSNRTIHHKYEKTNKYIIITSISIIDLITGWYQITQYDNKCAITITNFVETMWLNRYPQPMEILYDQG